MIILRRDEKDVSHFVTISRWESEGAIRDWAGGDLLKTKYYPEDQDFLLELEPEVEHLTVVGLAPDRRWAQGARPAPGACASARIPHHPMP